jgi:hypothetical protein
MALAANGTVVAESEIEAVAAMEEGGVEIGELERLARYFGLEANIEVTTVEDLERILEEGKIPIAYIDRYVFELNPRQRAKMRLRSAMIHTAIPVRLTESFVMLHDPLYDRVTRRSRRMYEEAHGRLGNCSVVCAKGQVNPNPC